jgi:hypothetical protein
MQSNNLLCWLQTANVRRYFYSRKSYSSSELLSLKILNREILFPLIQIQEVGCLGGFAEFVAKAWQMSCSFSG